MRCGQQMANDRNVKVILYGAVVVGNQSIYATIKGSKPIIGGVTANDADPTAKNAYFLNGSQTSVLGPFGTYTKRFLPKVKTVAIVYPNQPGRRHRRFRAQEGAAAGRREGDDDRHAAERDRSDRARDAGELCRHDHPRPRLHRLCPVRAGARPDPLLEAGALDCRSARSSPRRVYAGGDLPKWTFGIAQTLVNLRSPQSTLYLKKGLQYGTKVGTMLKVFAELAWEDDAGDREDHEHDPVQRISSATISAGFKNFKGPLILAAPRHRLRQGIAGRAGRLRKRDAVLQLPRPGEVESRLGLA